MTPRKGRKNEPLADRLLRRIESSGTVHRWPSLRWKDDPIGYAREVLQVKVLTEEQKDILRDIAQPRARVAVTSGHKTGKDYIGGICACWWYSLWADARVMITAVTGNQVKNVCWREVTAHHGNSQRGDYPLDGRVALLPASGVVTGPREIKGFTCEVKEAVAGISSSHVFYLVTEASGVPDYVFEAMAGNMAGEDCRMLLLSQPTHNDGAFYDAFHTKSSLWKRHTLRSDEVPNVKQNRLVVPAMATWEWLEEQASDWAAPPRWREIARGAPITAEDRAAAGVIWRQRVWGEFCEEEGDFKVIPLSVVNDAEMRWADMPTTMDPLVVGFDVAGTGADDNSAAARRGNKIIEIEEWTGAAFVDNDRAARETAARLMRFVRKHRRRRELPTLVVMDAGGTVGLRVYAALRVPEYKEEIIVIPVQFGAASTMPREYQWMRDQLWFGCARWLNEGGSLPPNRKLPGELTAPSWSFDEKSRKHVEKKDRLRQRLGRSTDRADSVILCVHEPRGGAAAQAQDEREAPGSAHVDNDPIYGGAADVYGGADLVYGGA